VVFDPASPYKGKVTAYDSPIYIADAALYLKATKPELGIVNPYELDDKQFQASVDLLKQQAGHRRGVLERLRQGGAGVQERLHRGRDELADHRQPGRGRKGAGQGGPAQRGQHRLVRTPGWSPPRRPTPTAPTGG
jgi:hypothetical protein